MQSNPVNPARRRVLALAVATAVAAPFAVLPSRRARAADLPHLAEDDPTAKALKYHHDATAAPRVDKSGTPAAEQFCHNCQFAKGNGGQWIPCQIFPGKAVNAEGWCTSWMPQA